ncbi:MAG: MFS transporter [Deltaproteobacteria bacterium]|nr:MFS transporter [Deltaproteobacteria bacterium]
MSERVTDLSLTKILLNPTVLVSGLGYFVDIYDLVLFSIVRVPSLNDLGITGPNQLEVGVQLLDMQMAGMLIGGILWGIMGDKRGRVSVLFGSILLYSLANLANAFVQNTLQYSLLRLLAGIGLAGELGAAIALVSESLPRHARGYGTCFVAAIGVSGAVFAGLVANFLSWRTAFLVGGLMGLALLVTRFRLLESNMFHKLHDRSVPKGDLGLIFKSPARLIRYLRCIVVGIPTWFCIGIIVTFSPEICRALGATGPVSAGTAVMCSYAGIVVGDLITGFIGQWWRSRKKVVGVFLTATLMAIVALLNMRGFDPQVYYVMSFVVGVATGYWAVFLTMAAEQFGTNIRALVSISVPNFVRGSVVLLTFVFKSLIPNFDLTGSALILGLTCIAVAFVALYGMEESFGADLDYVEESF